MNDNLKAAYPGTIEGWEGCSDKDSLPACDLRKNHCERLKLFLEPSERVNRLIAAGYLREDAEDIAVEDAGCGQSVIEPWR